MPEVNIRRSVDEAVLAAAATLARSTVDRLDDVDADNIADVLYAELNRHGASAAAAALDAAAGAKTRETRAAREVLDELQAYLNRAVTEFVTLRTREKCRLMQPPPKGSRNV